MCIWEWGWEFPSQCIISELQWEFMGQFQVLKFKKCTDASGLNAYKRTLRTSTTSERVYMMGPRKNTAISGIYMHPCEDVYFFFPYKNWNSCTHLLWEAVGVANELRMCKSAIFINCFLFVFPSQFLLPCLSRSFTSLRFLSIHIRIDLIKILWKKL